MSKKVPVLEGSEIMLVSEMEEVENNIENCDMPTVYIVRDVFDNHISIMYEEYPKLIEHGDFKVLTSDPKSNVGSMKNQIETLLKQRNISAYSIAKDTGITATSIGNYRNDLSRIGNMTLDNGIKLHNFYKDMMERYNTNFGGIVIEGSWYTFTESDFRVDTVTIEEEGIIQHYYYNYAIDEHGYDGTVYWEIPSSHHEEKRILDKDHVSSIAGWDNCVFMNQWADDYDLYQRFEEKNNR